MDIMRCILEKLLDAPKHRLSYLFVEPEPEDLLMELLKENQARVIILDTSEAVRWFRREIESLEYLQQSPDQVLEKLFVCLRDERDAEYKLASLWIDVELALTSTRNRQKRDEISRYLRASEEMGQSLLQQLKIMRLYKGGILPFQYVGCAVNDVVLQIPEIDDVPFRRLRDV